MPTPQDSRRHEEEALEAPPRLIAALKRAPKPAIFIPPTVDEAILRAAHRRLARPAPRQFKWFRWCRWGLAVAGLVTLLALVPQMLRKAAFSPSPGVVRGDLNQDGRVDVLDAFALARELKNRARPAPAWDINRDGVVDERDVATLAARAVSLDKGRRS